MATLTITITAPDAVLTSIIDKTAKANGWTQTSGQTKREAVRKAVRQVFRTACTEQATEEARKAADRSARQAVEAELDQANVSITVA